MTKISSFTVELRASCQKHPSRIAFSDSLDPRILEVARVMMSERSVSSVVLFTPRAATLALAVAQGIDLQPFSSTIVWAVPADAELSAGDRQQLAAEQLARGDVDAVLGGNIATTAEVIRAGIKKVGLAPGVRTVSGAFMLNRAASATAPEQTLLFADCGVVIAPTVLQLVDIAAASVQTWEALQPHVPAVVAFLSFSTKGSAKHPAQAQVAEAATLFRAEFPRVPSDGELQFDAAFDADIGARKAPGSAAAGRANCLIFPDLDAGNIAYKIAQRLGGFEAYGPILQGLAKPMNDLSRGATVADILTSAYITLSRATAQRG
ncbi:MAG: phosphate acyltransferase [Proteobacteria bacterium]|nr:phosphate acyltransferase [Pseudomonadota bacterium]